MPRKFTEEQIQEFSQLHKNGTSIKQLTADYNVSKSSLYKWFKQLGSERIVDGKTYNGRDIFFLQQEVEKLREELSIIHESKCMLKLSIEDRVNMMKELSDKYNIHPLSRAFEVRRSTYYHRILRSPKKTVYEEKDELLRPLIQEIFHNSKERFGSEKIRVKLIEQGSTVGAAKVSQLMKEMGLNANHKKPYRRANNLYKRNYRKNILQRQFDQPEPNLVWVSDFTYVKIGGVNHYICVIIDLFSRKVISYRISDKMNTHCVKLTFRKAFKERNQPKMLLFHSDQGSAFTSYAFRKYLRDLEVKQSFSEPGVPYDNSVVESLFAFMKREEIHRNVYDTLEQLQESVDEYIHFYNNERPHQRLGMKTPNAFEREYFEQIKNSLRS